jgi:hypothetical protein
MPGVVAAIGSLCSGKGRGSACVSSTPAINLPVSNKKPREIWLGPAPTCHNKWTLPITDWRGSMPIPVRDGALLSCSFGSAPGVLMVEGDRTGGKKPAASADTDLPRFGMCTSPNNPNVLTAIGETQGSLQAVPCEPAPGEWDDAQGRTLTGAAPLDSTCRVECAWSGIIEIRSPQRSG